MTLADAVATFGPVTGMMIYLYLNRPKADAKNDEATDLLRSMNERLIRIETRLELRK